MPLVMVIFEISRPWAICSWSCNNIRKWRCKSAWFKVLGDPRGVTCWEELGLDQGKEGDGWGWLRVESLTVSTTIGYIVRHEQGTIFAMSPISSFHHIALLFAPGSTGLKKTKEPQIISGCTVVNQLEGFIRVFFSSHNLSNGTQSKFLEAEGISGNISIEGSTVQQATVPELPR